MDDRRTAWQRAEARLAEAYLGWEELESVRRTAHAAYREDVVEGLAPVIATARERIRRLRSEVQSAFDAYMEARDDDRIG